MKTAVLRVIIFGNFRLDRKLKSVKHFMFGTSNKRKRKHTNYLCPLVLWDSASTISTELNRVDTIIREWPGWPLGSRQRVEYAKGSLGKASFQDLHSNVGCQRGTLTRFSCIEFMNELVNRVEFTQPKITNSVKIFYIRSRLRYSWELKLQYSQL